MKRIQHEHLFNWTIRFVKGMVVGSGAILPGVSGGALAAIFGLYEPIIIFLANIRKDFIKHFIYFLPIGLGSLFGIFLLATPIDYGLTHFPVPVLWGFIGAIMGTLPSLYKTAGKNGRKNKHLFLTMITAVITFSFLIYANNNFDVDVPQNTWSWLLAGGIFACGIVVPGLSPSNFLIYFNLYQPLTEGIRTLNLSIIIPAGIGSLVVILLVSKVIKRIIEMAYTTFFHFILGVVIASTAIIAPAASLYNYFEISDYFIVFISFLFGCVLGYGMGKLEEQYK